MHNLTRQPIHLHIANKGKIRRNTREQYIRHQPQVKALFISSHLRQQQNKTASPKLKQIYFFKKHDSLQRERKHFFQQNVTHVQSGSFRAIHTAYQFDSLKGFPLRSYTPIKPFRRGIRSSGYASNKPLQLQDLQTQQPTTKYMRPKYNSTQLHPFTVDNIAVFQSPEYVPKYNEIQNFQQFYVYRGQSIQQSPKITEQNPNSNTKLAGTKIQPFKKYKIRQVMRKTSNQRHTFNQAFELFK